MQSHIPMTLDVWAYWREFPRTCKSCKLKRRTPYRVNKFEAWVVCVLDGVDSCDETKTTFETLPSATRALSLVGENGVGVPEPSAFRRGDRDTRRTEEGAVEVRGS